MQILDFLDNNLEVKARNLQPSVALTLHGLQSMLHLKVSSYEMQNCNNLQDKQKPRICE